MSETRVVHVNDKIEGAVYIGRANARKKLKASPFANPHKIQGGDRRLVIDKYEIDITEGPLRPLLADLPALRGKALACWCRHDGEEWSADTWCHGDVLRNLLDSHTDDELRAMAAADIPLHWCQTCNQPMNAGRFADGIDEEGVEFNIWESYCTRCDPATPCYPAQEGARKARVHLRISLAEAGQALGITAVELSDLEMGRAEADPAILNAMQGLYGPFCRDCGCTEDRACEGGCYWIEPDLCSRCALGDGPPDALPAWRLTQLLVEQRDLLAEHEERLSGLEEDIDDRARGGL